MMQSMSTRWTDLVNLAIFALFSTHQTCQKSSAVMDVVSGRLYISLQNLRQFGHLITKLIGFVWSQPKDGSDHKHNISHFLFPSHQLHQHTHPFPMSAMDNGILTVADTLPVTKDNADNTWYRFQEGNTRKKNNARRPARILLGGCVN